MAECYRSWGSSEIVVAVVVEVACVGELPALSWLNVMGAIEE